MMLHALNRAAPLAVALAVLGGGNANASSEAPATMPIGAPTAAPTGFIEMCERTLEDCLAGPRSTDRMLAEVRDWAGRERWAAVFQTAGMAPGATPPSLMPRPVATVSKLALEAVSRRINRAIRRASDVDSHAREDVWVLPGGQRPSGDCEDYVLAKRTALIAEGVPAQALSIAVARNTSGQSHAVLVVSTDKGDVVLDNLSYWIRPWAEVPYQWIMRQNRGDANDWRAIVSVDRVGQTPSRGTRSRRL